ncbi:hypothetical protein LMG1864_03226 [Achromobacter ruhlandii]|nr:hypothetical protein LMG1864_03226 [Achromobacter ruhlandii]
MHAADRHQMGDAGAIENDPVFARHARLVADRQGDQHRRVTVAIQRAPHALAHPVACPFDGNAGRRPWPVVQQTGLPAHRAGGPQAAREQARLAIRGIRVERRVRPAQHQRHAPYLPGNHARRARRPPRGQAVRPARPPARRRALGGQPRDQNASGNSRLRRLHLLGGEAHPARVVVGQFHDAQRQPRHGILVHVGQRVIQAPLRLPRGIERADQQAQQQGRHHPGQAPRPAARGQRHQRAGRARPYVEPHARQDRQALHRPRACHHGQAEYAPFDVRLLQHGPA